MNKKTKKGKRLWVTTRLLPPPPVPTGGPRQTQQPSSTGHPTRPTRKRGPGPWIDRRSTRQRETAAGPAPLCSVGHAIAKKRKARQPSRQPDARNRQWNRAGASAVVLKTPVKLKSRLDRSSVSPGRRRFPQGQAETLAPHPIQR